MQRTLAQHKLSCCSGDGFGDDLEVSILVHQGRPVSQDDCGDEAVVERAPLEPTPRVRRKISAADRKSRDGSTGRDGSSLTSCVSWLSR